MNKGDFYKLLSYLQGKDKMLSDLLDELSIEYDEKNRIPDSVKEEINEFIKKNDDDRLANNIKEVAIAVEVIDMEDGNDIEKSDTFLLGAYHILGKIQEMKEIIEKEDIPYYLKSIIEEQLDYLNNNPFLIDELADNLGFSDDASLNDILNKVNEDMLGVNKFINDRFLPEHRGRALLKIQRKITDKTDILFTKGYKKGLNVGHKL